MVQLSAEYWSAESNTSCPPAACGAASLHAVLPPSAIIKSAMLSEVDPSRGQYSLVVVSFDVKRNHGLLQVRSFRPRPPVRSHLRLTFRSLDDERSGERAAFAASFQVRRAGRGGRHREPNRSQVVARRWGFLFESTRAYCCTRAFLGERSLGDTSGLKAVNRRARLALLRPPLFSIRRCHALSEQVLRMPLVAFAAL